MTGLLTLGVLLVILWVVIGVSNTRKERETGIPSYRTYMAASPAQREQMDLSNKLLELKHNDLVEQEIRRHRNGEISQTELNLRLQFLMGEISEAQYRRLSQHGEGGN